MALMGEGEVMLGTNNRNFLGRFGSPRAKAYLVNPEVAAASAIAGEIASVRGWASHFRAVFPQQVSRRFAFFAAL